MYFILLVKYLQIKQPGQYIVLLCSNGNTNWWWFISHFIIFFPIVQSFHNMELDMLFDIHKKVPTAPPIVMFWQSRWANLSLRSKHAQTAKSFFQLLMAVAVLKASPLVLWSAGKCVRKDSRPFRQEQTWRAQVALQRGRGCRDGYSDCPRNTSMYTDTVNSTLPENCSIKARPEHECFVILRAETGPESDS